MPGLSTLKLVGIGLIAGGLLGAFLYVRHLNSQVEHLRDDNAVLRQNAEIAANVARQNADQLLIQRRHSEQDMEAVQDRYEARIRAAEDRNKILEEIAHAPPEDDAPAAPVLDRTVRRLYGTHAPADADPSD